MSELAHTNHTEKKDFLVRSSSLKDVRSFCREVFEKLHIDQSLKDELVLAIAEAHKILLSMLTKTHLIQKIKWLYK